MGKEKNNIKVVTEDNPLLKDLFGKQEDDENDDDEKDKKKKPKK